jgi:hypothetical protein
LLQVAERQWIASRNFCESRVDFQIVAEIFVFWGLKKTLTILRGGEMGNLRGSLSEGKASMNRRTPKDAKDKKTREKYWIKRVIALNAT